MNYKKSDVEILMGILLYRKWDKKGIVYAKKIKGMGKKHKYDLIYYINKDLMKPSTYNCLKLGASKWGFGKGYKFENVEAFSSSQYVSVNYAIHKRMTTKQKFIEYYNSLRKDGYKLFFKKIRFMK